MSYNDFPGCSDSYDSNESVEQSKLDAAYATRAAIMAEMGVLSREGDTHTVLDVYYPNIDDARLVRGLRMDRHFRDLDRLDATIARLMLEVGPVDTIDGWDPDALLDDAAA